MDTAQWPQEIVMKPMEEIVPKSCSSNPSSAISTPLERRVKPQKDQALNCPRCNSTSTKFCYYNNYSLSQPRYFCKTCRRYWTEGGSLRNIPVGGGSRKNKRSSNSLSNSPSSPSNMSKKLNINNEVSHHQSLSHGGQDLNLVFNPSSTNDFKTISELIQMPNFDANDHNTGHLPSSTISKTSASHLSAMELLNGVTTRGLMSSFMQMPISDPNAVYSSGFEFKLPSLSFSLDGMGIGSGNTDVGTSYGGLQESASNNASGRLLFPFEDLKQVTSTASDTHDHHVEQDRDHNGDSNGYWNGMLGNGGSW